MDWKTHCKREHGTGYGGLQFTCIRAVLFHAPEPILPWAARGFIGLMPGKKDSGIDGIAMARFVPGEDLRSNGIVGALYPGGGADITFRASGYPPPLPGLRHPPEP
jgi:hypothetical protein